MFDIEQLSAFYIDVLFSPFAFIVLFAALIATPVGIWAVKKVKVSAWCAAIAFLLFLLTLLYICYEKITLGGILYANIFADVFLGAVVGFLISILVIRLRERESYES